MRNIFLLLFVVIRFLDATAQQTYETITVDNQVREYYKYLPLNYDANTENLPIIIVLHGLGGTALSLTAGGINQIADTARFIPLYLQGLPNFLGQNSWNNGTGLASTPDDILFISKVIDEVNSTHGIDLTKVYMVGISMGAIMTFHTLTVLNNRIAAVSCHIGTMSTQDITNYNPTFPIPVQQIHGTNDQTVPYDGTPLTSLSLVPETLNKLKTVNGWLGDSIITNIPDIVNDGINIEKIEYNCTGAPLEHWKLNGADHIFLYQPANDTSGIFVSWYFLRQFSHPNPIAVGIDENKPKHQYLFDFYPNPANNLINITNYNQIEIINIYNTNGQLMSSHNSQQQININHLSKGLYFIEFIDENNNRFKKKLIIN